MIKISKIQTEEECQKASDFLATTNAFEDSLNWNETEREHLSKTPFKVLKNAGYYAWILTSKNNEVIGYIDLREHDLKNGGYYTDWFAVHKDLRSKGYGGEMLSIVEKFAKEIGGRYVLIETGDIEIYARTRNFYEKHGYQKVGHIPEYYYANWGMCIYQKQL